MLRLTRLDDSDLARLESALDAAGLPYDDVREAGRFFYWSDGPHASFVGLEVFGGDALLRSLVVPLGARGKGLGRRVVETLLVEASESGIERLWLLTTTAEAFFAAIGFEPVARQEAPPAIRTTREFRDLCPASATFMKLDLARNRL
ncbi:arsenic resistance N-acetyltransferase ArsN2 [Sphingosinicella humi]|uniref:arsenic resistance N-acetyltransferase ArsN2 n=1 Tax=Allosphingosinicella humi TaxID=2068657 RepID=UPI001A9C288E|nr:arsenic resistance N-acetyltransferase ArsN2 [Sphingosinicella humi]